MYLSAETVISSLSAFLLVFCSSVISSPLPVSEFSSSDSVFTLASAVVVVLSEVSSADSVCAEVFSVSLPKGSS